MSNWWENASVSSRLSQIDGAIEVGMSIGQTARCLRTAKYKVEYLARAHGRSFSTKRRDPRHSSGGGKVSGLMNARRSGISEVEVTSAFNIFGNRHSSSQSEMDWPDELA